MWDRGRESAGEGRFRKETEQGSGFLRRGIEDTSWSEVRRQEWASLAG